MKVICNSIGSVPSHSNAPITECSMCGASKFHDPSSCEPCPWNKTAKCIQPFSLFLNFQTPYVKELANSIEDKDLIVAFMEYANSLPQCIGLAANQVMMNDERLMKRFFVLRYSVGWVPVLNPEIIQYCGEPKLTTEGCKTWPGQPIIVRRYPKIIVQGESLPFKEGEESKIIQKTLVALEAQVFQHEIDHLNGVEEKFTNCIQREKTGRNDSCPCGSGKKYKNCCLSKSLK